MTREEQQTWLVRIATVRDVFEDGEPYTATAVSTTCERQGMQPEDVAFCLRILKALDVVRIERWEGDNIFYLNK